LELVRTNTTAIINVFHFDFKPPFLMARPDDAAKVKHDVLSLFIDSACVSGNFMKIFSLFNPSDKLDGKASRSLRTVRTFYGIDRLDIFERYVKELNKIVMKKMEKGRRDNQLMQRAMDSLERGTLTEMTPGLKSALEELFVMVWKAVVGKDPEPESNVQDLKRFMANEEEDEEEDDEFVNEDSSVDEDDESGRARPGSGETTGDVDSEEESESESAS
jgi:hypothetical protein